MEIMVETYPSLFRPSSRGPTFSPAAPSWYGAPGPPLYKRRVWQKKRKKKRESPRFYSTLLFSRIIQSLTFMYIYRNLVCLCDYVCVFGSNYTCLSLPFKCICIPHYAYRLRYLSFSWSDCKKIQGISFFDFWFFSWFYFKSILFKKSMILCLHFLFVNLKKLFLS